MMALNIGNVDRLVRILVGVALLGASLMGLVGPWGWIGIVPIATGLVAWCPLYRVLGIRTTAR
jgi:hypothetical protein